MPKRAAPAKRKTVAKRPVRIASIHLGPRKMRLENAEELVLEGTVAGGGDRRVEIGAVVIYWEMHFSNREEKQTIFLVGQVWNDFIIDMPRNDLELALQMMCSPYEDPADAGMFIELHLPRVNAIGECFHWHVTPSREEDAIKALSAEIAQLKEEIVRLSEAKMTTK